MNEREFAHKLTQQLNRTPVSADTAQRLRAAREAAVRRATTPIWIRAGGALVQFWQRHHATSIGLLLAILIALSGASWQWHQHRTHEADRALEVQMLADELPVDVFLSEKF